MIITFPDCKKVTTLNCKLEYKNTLQRGGGRGVRVERRGRGTNQGTGMNDPWTWTTGWGLTVGVQGGLGREEERGKYWGSCNRNSNKIFKFKNELEI